MKGIIYIINFLPLYVHHEAFNKLKFHFTVVVGLFSTWGQLNSPGLPLYAAGELSTIKILERS